MAASISIERVPKSGFYFRSDIKPATLRLTHPSGILHAFKYTKKNGRGEEHAFHRREEHAFAWIDNIEEEVGVAWVKYMLVQHGFEEYGMKFIPYSGCENWVHRYPHACPYMELVNGYIKGVPYFEQCINSNAATTSTTNIGHGYYTNSSSTQQINNGRSSSSSSSNRPAKRQKVSNKGNKLIPSATLYETERSQLHVEIYKYMAWLYSTLLQIEKEGAPWTVRRSGISVPGLQNLLTKLEKTFRNVGEYKTNEDEKKRKKQQQEEEENEELNGADNEGGEDVAADIINAAEENTDDQEAASPLPMLEECFELELRRIADEAKHKEAQQKKSKQSEAQLRVVEEQIVQQQAVLERGELQRMVLTQQPMINCVIPTTASKDKDPNAPRSSYFYFTVEERPKIQLESPNMNVTDMDHVMGQRWRALPSEDKKKYEDLAEGDTANYKREQTVEAPKNVELEQGAQTNQEEEQIDGQKNEVQPVGDEKQQENEENAERGIVDDDFFDNTQDPIDFDNSQEEHEDETGHNSSIQEQEAEEHRDIAFKLVANAINKENEEEGMLDFDAMVQRLLAYKKERGYIDARQQYKDSDGVCLGQWVYRLRQRRHELHASGLECELPVHDGSNADFATLAVSQGRLGLSLTMQEVGGALITSIESSSSFKDRIAVGDVLITIDGEVVRTVQDLAKGKEKKVRMFGIAKKVNRVSTFLSMERVERLEKMGFLWSSPVEKPSKIAKAWDDKFQLLKQFKEENGRWPTRQEKWNGLGEWIRNQRRSKTRQQKEFMEYRAIRLDEIDFPWRLRDPGKLTPWEDHLQMLAEFYRVNRHFNVPHPQKSTSDNISDKEKAELDEALKFHQWHSQLNIWYSAYKNGLKTTRLDEKRVKQLEDLGFEFGGGNSTTHSRNQRSHIPDLPFGQRVEQLKKIEAEIGHMNIDPRFDSHGNLGGWAAEMSMRYKSWKSGKEISSELEDHFNELSRIGFEFTVSHEYPPRRSWDNLFGSLLEFIEKFGHSKVPQKCKFDMRLGAWVAKQRQEYKLFMDGKHSKTTQEQFEKLDSVNFIWDATKDNKRDRRQARLEAEDCSEQRINYGMKHNDKCTMCYRKTKDSGLSSKERRKKCRSSRMGCAKCQEPICQECWDEGYDNPNHLK